MVRSLSPCTLLRVGCELTRPKVRLLAFVSSLALAPACTLVVGDRPVREDAGDDVTQEQDGAVEEDAGFDAGSSEDGGDPGDAGSEGDASSADAALMDAAPDAERSDAEPPDAALMDAAPDASESSDAGQEDSALPDTGPPPDCGSNTGTIWYPDGDGDGYGRSAEAVQACEKPAIGSWVVHGGDCKDNDLNVRPGQPLYFGVPYRGANGTDSYDYDCSGSEEGNPGKGTLMNGCGVLELIACKGTGYLPGTRTGANVNPFCGSERVGTCMAGPIGLGCTTAMSMDEPYECK